MTTNDPLPVLVTTPRDSGHRLRPGDTVRVAFSPRSEALKPHAGRRATVQALEGERATIAIEGVEDFLEAPTAELRYVRPAWVQGRLL